MKKTALLLCALLLPLPAHAVALKGTGTITGPSIMLSDVFLGLPFEQDRVLAAAPAPGRSISYAARDLALLARRYKLDVTVTQENHLTLTRASHNFDAPALAEAVQAALGQQNGAPAGSRTEIMLDNTVVSLNAPLDSSATLSIENLKVTGARFTALAKVSDGAQVFAQIPLLGRIRTLVSVPVLSRALRKGDVISGSDLAWQDMELAAQGGDWLADADALLGKTPRTTLRPGVPVRAIDILTPALVFKGRQVTLVYKTAGMIISTEGRALADGAAGDAVRVVNLRSSRTLEGTVLADGSVRLGPSEGQLAALNTRTTMN